MVNKTSQPITVIDRSPIIRGLERIRLIRELSQKDFCTKIGLPITTYERWLRSPHIIPRFTPRQWQALSVLSQLNMNELPEFLEQHSPEQS